MIGLFHSFTVYYTKNWRDATSTGNFLEGIQGRPGRTRTCAFTGIAVSFAQAKGGQWQLALSFFEGMLSAQISPDVVTFSASISAINSASWQHSLKLFEQMFMSTLAPDDRHQWRVTQTVSICFNQHQAGALGCPVNTLVTASKTS